MTFPRGTRLGEARSARALILTCLRESQCIKPHESRTTAKKHQRIACSVILRMYLLPSPDKCLAPRMLKDAGAAGAQRTARARLQDRT